MGVSLKRALRTPAVAWMMAALLALPAVLSAAQKDINVVEQSKNDNGFLTAAAGHFANPLRVTSKADLAAKVLGALGPGDCIGTLTLVGHGDAGIIGTGDGQGNEQCKHINGNSAEWKPALAGLKGKFCPGAKIVLWGCHVGSEAAGAAKLKEIADYFNVPVSAQTGSVYGNGTTETGSQTVTATPGQPAPKPVPKPTTACKKKKKTVTQTTNQIATTSPSPSPSPSPAPVPVPLPDPGTPPERTGTVVFPNAGTPSSPVPVSAGDIASVAFVPPSLLSVMFSSSPTAPLQQSASLTSDGQLYLTQNGVTNRSLIQQIAAGVTAGTLANTQGLGSKLSGGIVMKLYSGQTLLYFATGGFAYLFDQGGDPANSLEPTCDGAAVYSLLTEETLPFTILNAKLAPAIEDELIAYSVNASRFSQQEDYTSANQALDQLIADTQARQATGEIPSAAAAQIVFDSGQLKTRYTAEQGTTGTTVTPTDQPATPGTLDTTGH